MPLRPLLFGSFIYYWHSDLPPTHITIRWVDKKGNKLEMRYEPNLATQQTDNGEA